MHDGTLKKAGHNIYMARTANATVPKRWVAPFRGSLKGLQLHTASPAPTSAEGTYLFTAAKNGTNILAATNFDLEALEADTTEDLTLSTAAGVLDFEAGDVFAFGAVSNNADLTAGPELAVVLKIDKR